MSYKVFVSNIVGCESTASEGSRVVNYLKLNGHAVLGDPADAEYLIVNTCAFVEVQRRKMKERLDDLVEKAPGAKLIVMGCAREIAPDRLTSYEIHLVCGHYDLPKLDAIFAERVPFEKVPSLSLDAGESHVVVVASRGCVETCTYCSIKRATGAVKSRPAGEILADIEKAVAEGRRDFWITGDDVGSYGLDLGSNLPALLKALTDAKLDIKVLLGNINPRWINEYIDDLVAFFEGPVARKWLFMPVQSANNDVLRAMGRKYTIESCIEIIGRLKGIEKMKYHYDLMVGFPAETEEAFAETVDFVLHYPPSSVMLATYSPEEGTAAYDMDPLPKDVSRERMHRLNMACAAGQNILSKIDPGLVREFGS